MSDERPLKLRHDPRPYLRSLATVEGLSIRRLILNEVVPGDWELGERLMRKILSEQDADGSWGQCLKRTGQRMLELLDLDVVANHPSLEYSAEWLLGNLEPVFDRPLPFTLEQNPGLLALVRIGRHYEQPVQRVVTQLTIAEEHWLPEASPEELFATIELLLADPNERDSATVPRAVEALVGWVETAEATDADRMLCLEVCGMTDFASARDWVEQRLPLVIDSQAGDGGWGSQTRGAVGALCSHGFWESLLP